MAVAMRAGGRHRPDRVPVMCQLALGHYFLNTGLDPIDIWHDTPAFGDALVMLQRRYGFDGILVNLPGRDPEWRRHVRAIDRHDGRAIVRWPNALSTIVPDDDNPRVVVEASGRGVRPTFAAIDPERLFYVEPHDASGITYPQTWGSGRSEATPGPDFFPPWHWDTLKLVRQKAPDVSVHGEVFSPFSQLMELVGCEAGMMALVEDPMKVTACLDRLAEGAAALARGHFEAGADAVLISSAYAGAGLISRRHYETFVLPSERTLIAEVGQAFPDRPIYTHTCGAIGDRLELMERTGTHGIDTLDPPPLGTVDLADARRRLGRHVFIKGNIDPVNTILRGTPEECYRGARERLRIAGEDGGYILSTACSVPPRAPEANLAQLVRAAEDAG
jgi:hypothetical protein